MKASAAVELNTGAAAVAAQAARQGSLAILCAQVKVMLGLVAETRWENL